MATIRSCPIIIAAWPTLLVGGGTLASAAGSPSASLRPSPKSRGGVGERVRLQLAGQRDEGGVARLREVAAERHRAGGVALEVAGTSLPVDRRACAGSRPSPSTSSPARSSAVVDDHLERRAGRVEAGPARGRSVESAGRLATARMSPVEGWTATSAALPFTGRPAHPRPAACTSQVERRAQRPPPGGRAARAASRPRRRSRDRGSRPRGSPRRRAAPGTRPGGPTGRSRRRGRAAVGLLELLGRRRPDGAEQRAGERLASAAAATCAAFSDTPRIASRLAAIAVVVGLAQGDDRDEAALRRRADPLCERGRVGVDAVDRGQPARGLGRVADLRHLDRHVDDGTRLHDRPAVAREDPAARGCVSRRSRAASPRSGAGGSRAGSSAPPSARRAG